MKENLQKDLNNIIKNLILKAWLPVILIALAIIIIFAGAVYLITLDDGTYEEDDWSNTQYGASQYTNNVTISSGGEISTTMTAQELWDKLRDEDGRVNLYLDGPEELLKLMNAQVVTQYLDTRSEDEIDDPIDWDEISDINSTDIQGIIKLKRRQSDDTTITMTYVDPETFQSYIDEYNSTGSESARQEALSHFTLEKTTVASTTTSTTETDSEDEETDATDSELYWPTAGITIKKEFNLYDENTEIHRGIDIGVGIGAAVYACEAGTVTTAGWSDVGGYMIEIDHGNGYVSKYMHNSELLVAVGDTVEQGQQIAKSGNTGDATEPSLHFQIEYNGTSVDPLSFKYHNGMGDGTEGFGESGGTVSEKQYYAKVATWSSVTETVESNDPDVETYSTTTYTMTTTNINYQQLVSGYTMPFDYLWDLLVISKDQDFVLELADLVLNSEIEITVHDNLSINTNVNTYTYTENEQIISRDAVIVSEFLNAETQRDYADESAPQVTSIDRYVVHTTITQTNTLDIALTKANVWIVNYTQEYTYEVPDTVVTEGGAGDLEDIEYTDDPDHTTTTDDIGFGEANRQLYENIYSASREDFIQSTLTQVYSDYYYSTTNRNETIENTLEKTTYVSSPATIEEKTDKDSEEPNFVTILLDNKKAANLILDTSDWLFTLLERNDSTVDMIDLTKYLLYKATGKNYGVTEFDFSIFDPANFASNSNGSSGIEGVPGQIYDYFLDKGVPAAGVAAMLGNIERESSFNTDADNGIGYYGLCQWGGGRFTSLQNLANSKGTDWTDLETQLDFIWQELNGSYSHVKEVLMSATDEDDLEYATWYFGRYYEIFHTGSWESSRNKEEVQNRYECAQKWYEQYVQNSASIVAIAKQCHDYLRTNGYSYSNIYNKNIPLDENSNKVVDCSSFVSWVLYEYGYTELAGSQQTTSTLYSLAVRKGWTIKSGAEAQAGDILLNPNSHTSIYAGNNQSYDCGNDTAIQSEIKSCNPASFQYSITVTKP